MSGAAKLEPAPTTFVSVDLVVRAPAETANDDATMTATKPTSTPSVNLFLFMPALPLLLLLLWCPEPG